MRRAFPLVLLLLLAASSAFACGDKFLVSGRNRPYAQARLPKGFKPASVLIYANKPAGERKAFNARDLQTRIQGVGHKVKVANNAAALKKELESKKFDIVVAEVQDSEAVQRALDGAASKAALLPAVSSESSVELAKGGERVLRVSAKPDDIRRVIEDTLATRK